MEVVLSRAARDDLTEIDTWWRVNRPDAPDAVRDDVDRALARLGRDAAIIPVFGRAGASVIRRLHLGRTRRHLYFTIEEGRVIVAAIWGSVRGILPKLRDRARSER